MHAFAPKKDGMSSPHTWTSRKSQGELKIIAKKNKKNNADRRLYIYIFGETKMLLLRATVPLTSPFCRCGEK